MRRADLTTLCADCLEIWEPQPTGTLWVFPGLQWYWFTFTGGSLSRRRFAKEVSVTSEHLECRSFTPSARKYLQQLAVSYGDGYTSLSL